MALPIIRTAAILAKYLETSVALVTMRGGTGKKYSYFMPNDSFEVGDDVIVPTETGGPLTATIVMISSAKRYVGKATKTIESKA